MPISHNWIEFHQKHAESTDLDEYLWFKKKFMRKFHRSLEKSAQSFFLQKNDKLGEGNELALFKNRIRWNKKITILINLFSTSEQNLGKVTVKSGGNAKEIDTLPR